MNANGEQRSVNITLIGQGRVTVTVRDASENLINHAHVVISSQTAFGGSHSFRLASYQSVFSMTGERINIPLRR